MWDWPGASFDGNPAGGVIAADGGCPNRLVKYDVRSAASYWAANPSQSFGLVLDTNAWDNNYWKKFASSEAGAPPALHVGWSEPATRPSPPQSVAASPRNAAAVVTWAPPASNGGAAITNYVVGSYIWNGSTWVLLNAYYPCGTCTSWTVSGLANGYTYVFGVWAQNSAGTSDGVTSNTIIAGTPSAPQNPAASVRNLGALVTWTAPVSAGASAIDAYGVFAYKYPSLEYVGYTQGCGTCTSVKVIGLTNGQQYIFGVYAHNSVNWGPGVATNVITPGPTVPDAPPNVFAAPVANGTVDVAWSAPSDNGGSTIDHYWLGVYKTTPTVTYVSSVTACPTCSPKNIGGLTAGQSYQFYVAAHNVSGYGPLTGSNVVTAGSSPDLLKPTNVQVTRGDGRATVTWTPPVIRLGGLTSYVVKAFLESNPTQAVATTTVADPATTATITGLTNGQQHFVTVTASTLLVINAESARSAVFVPAGPPLAPTSVTATRGDMAASVSWPTPNSNGEPITGYEVATVNPVTGAEIAVVPITQSPADIGGLINGTRYAFKVRAINAVGTGPYSPLSNTVIPAGRPFPPENVTATPGNTQVTVSWDAPSTQADGRPGDNGDAITSYAVNVEPGGRVITVDGAVTSAVVTGLDNGTLYLFTVTANNAVGASDPGSAVAVPAAPPISPANVTASPLDASAMVQWSPSSPPGVPVTYTVVASPGGRSVSTMSTSAVVDGLTNGQEYTFTVQATNSAGTSAVSLASNPVTPTSSTLPPPGPQCQTSTLPPPPDEVRLPSGAVRQRIDVPCMPGLYGRVRLGFFIEDEEVQILPGFRVVGDGDGRGFDPAMGPDDNRVYIEVDYSTGTGFVQSNRSCTDKTETDCEPAKSLANAFVSVTHSDGRVSFEFTIGNALGQRIPLFNRLKISADMDIVPMPGGALCVTGSASWFPALEAYYDRGAQTQVIFQYPQIDLGIWGLAIPDHGVRGCL